MARRKHQVLDDGDSSPVSDADEIHIDDNDPDARAERELFENPYTRKRRRKNAEDAIYGVFMSDDDEEDDMVARRKAKTRSTAPSFVTSKETLDQASSKTDEVQLVDEDEADASNSSDPPSPRVQAQEVEEEEEEERPRFGGLGLGASKGGIGAGKRGLGSETPSFTKGGIGSSHPAPPDSSSSPSPAPVASEDFPTAFGGARPQRSFLRKTGSSASTPRSVTPLSTTEQMHFAKISGTFGARMLSKMGWQTGQGLGSSGEGIVAPVESKLRPKGMGLAFKGFREKTEQAKAEARRRGEIVSDDEDSKNTARKARKAAKDHEARTDAWRKTKKTKTRIEHKTYEEIIAEADEAAAPQAGVGPIIDATGATLREVSSLAEVVKSSWTPSTDPMRLPEIRHNLRLITESCRTDLDGLAREARALEERKRWIRAEDARLRKQVDEEAELIARMQHMNIIVAEINNQSREAASMYEASLEPFSAGFNKLIGDHANEFDRYRLDEVVVAAIAPVIRRMLAQWQPLEDPTAFTASFRAWRRALKMVVPEDNPITQVQVYGNNNDAPVEEKPMTPYESLLWNTWLPRVRSSLNNDWSPEDATPAVRLYEAWSSFLPPFIRDNFFDQLILPKVQRAVSDWNPRNSKYPLQTLVFPWLPYLGLRLEDVLGDARRKVKSVLRAWSTSDMIPQDLAVWRDVFDVGDWDTMLLKYVVPKLGSRLREDFRINPRQQDMQPLQDVMLWERLLRPTVLSQILEKEFFPKWLDVLYIWLIQPNASLAEVSRWYEEWKKAFSEKLQNTPGVSQGFTRGLQLMNKALELGPEAPLLLPRPDHTVPLSGAANMPKPKDQSRPARTQEVTFRSLVEDHAAAHNMLFLPAGKVHEQSRMPLYRVSPTADGKGGVLVYILDDAVWAADAGGVYRAITMDDMILRATK